MKYSQALRVYRPLWVLMGSALLSACYIEGGGCSGPVCFGVSTDVCSGGLLCNERDDQVDRCPDLDDIEVEATLAVNRVRGDARSCSLAGTTSLNSIVWNEQLFAAADAHSRDMASNNFVNALGSDGLGVNERLGDIGAGYVSQLVAGGFPSADELISSWAADSRECGQILSERASSFALACRFDDDSQFGTYWTLVVVGQ